MEAFAAAASRFTFTKTQMADVMVARPARGIGPKHHRAAGEGQARSGKEGTDPHWGRTGSQEGAGRIGESGIGAGAKGLRKGRLRAKCFIVWQHTISGVRCNLTPSTDLMGRRVVPKINYPEHSVNTLAEIPTRRRGLNWDYFASHSHVRRRNAGPKDISYDLDSGCCYIPRYGGRDERDRSVIPVPPNGTAGWHLINICATDSNATH